MYVYVCISVCVYVCVENGPLKQAFAVADGRGEVCMCVYVYIHTYIHYSRFAATWLSHLYSSR